ncbi:CAAX protease self-immunity-domain-containing protein [Hygrophoropsis aurantiaca]|uniref:CAAX protease self-immunity-domain-containing protein n=1 Tax=Hygrophoropsis aurantiaca TaxID=72124 RepID=A0ACB8ALD7_9AGAM|nr:CAAX protease self-immunity-domain-containing protein [Hygrophoropsis aurantiaca]
MIPLYSSQINLNLLSLICFDLTSNFYPLFMPSPGPPLLSTTSAHLIALLFACSYVGSIYASQSARLSFKPNPPNLQARSRYERSRDDPEVIKARLISVSIATFLCCAGVFVMMWHLVDGDVELALNNTFTHLGLKYISIYPLLVTPLLFLGPLYGRYLFQSLPLQQRWSFKTDVISFFFSIRGIRNYILAPITEEIVFRACVISVYQSSGASKTRMIFLSPISFGAAHLHHAWDTYNRYGRTAMAAKQAIIGTLFQFAYTSIFGFYCAYLFLRTGSIFPPIVAHVFCNIMGVPQPGTEMKQSPNRKLAIAVMYVVGILGFISTLGPWTHVEDSLYW